MAAGPLARGPLCQAVPVIDDGRGAVALEESRGALDKQNEDLSRLRDRSMALVGVGGVAAGLFVGLRPGAEPLTDWTWAGLAAFALVAFIATIIATPITWYTNMSATRMLEWVEAEDPDREVMERELASHLEDSYDRNEGRLKALTLAYTGASVGFLAEVSLLLLDVRT
jgi:hypothetical protein